MKTSKILILFWLLQTIFISSANAQFKSSNLRVAFEKTKTTHSYNAWTLNDVKGENKVELAMEAIEYHELKSANTVLSGIMLKMKLEVLANTEVASKIEKNYFAYIDESEFPEIILALNNIIEDIKIRKKKEQYGSLFYITNDGIKIEYNYRNSKEYILISFLNDTFIASAEFSDDDSFFQEWVEQIDIASKKLYLPENAEKLKNVKKSNQEAKDVIIDDI